MSTRQTKFQPEWLHVQCCSGISLIHERIFVVLLYSLHWYIPHPTPPPPKKKKKKKKKLCFLLLNWWEAWFGCRGGLEANIKIPNFKRLHLTYLRWWNVFVKHKIFPDYRNQSYCLIVNNNLGENMFCRSRSFSSGKFEFVSGKCLGILFFPFRMNPDATEVRTSNKVNDVTLLRHFQAYVTLMRTRRQSNSSFKRLSKTANFFLSIH